MLLLSARFWLAVIGALGVGAPISGGAEAAFSADGREICLLERAEDDAVLVRIGPSPAAARKVALPAGAERKAIAVAGSAHHGWLQLTGDDVWRRAPGKEVFEHWLHCETMPKWTDLAVDPKTGNVLFSAAGAEDTILQLHVRAENGLRNVLVRRARRPFGFAFAPDGKVFFAHEGDLWGGEIELEEFEDEGETRRIASLTASRFAPLADLETANVTPNSTGVTDVAATRTHVYVHLARMGGSGWGWIARVPRPGKRTEDFARGLRARAATLGATSLLGANARISYLAAAPDGRVMYRLDQPDRFFLHARPDGPAQPWER